MATVEVITWTKTSRPTDLVDWAGSAPADYIATEIHPTFVPLDLINAEPCPDIVVVFDRTGRARWRRLRDLLPAPLYLVAAPADDDRVVCLRKNSIESHAQVLKQSTSLTDATIRLAELGSVAFVECDQSPATDVFIPKLTTLTGPRFPSLRDIVHGIQIPGGRTSTTKLLALKAGFFLINDFFDESHSCSQSIEGMGPHHTGDYWHAILHRREPDYGNSKYWFRNIGRHPVFAEIAQTVSQHLESASGSLGGKLDRWKDRLLANNRWDPFAFVDLCSAAEKDAELRDWCEGVQLEEILLLLEATYREAVES